MVKTAHKGVKSVCFSFFLQYMAHTCIRFSKIYEPWTEPLRTRSQGPVQVQIGLNLEPNPNNPKIAFKL